MTHTLHRQGTKENLANDYLILPFPGSQSPDIQKESEQFIQICLKHEPVNKENLCSFRIYVFDDKGKVDKVLQELVEADMGISIVVSGLYDKVCDCCRNAGLKPHTINYSLGFWGNANKIPGQQLFELTSMCGHSLISPNLALDMANRVVTGYPAAIASEEMAKVCLCELFNTRRGEALLEKLAADIKSGNSVA